MKLIKLKLTKFVMLFLILNIHFGIVLAFPDLYEPNNEPQQATPILVEDKNRQQYTLHSEDVDWFKFYAAEGIKYEAIIDSVGADLDIVIELYDHKGTLLDKDDSFVSQRAPAEGWYLIKISDSAAASEQCRVNIQYELRVARTIAPVLGGEIGGFVTDALSGKPIENAIIYSSCAENNRVPSLKGGHYSLISKTGSCKLKVKAEGYQPLTCQIQVPPKFLLQINLPLLPQNQTMPPLSSTQAVYQNGDQLRIEFLPSLRPPQTCLRYYFGIVYPDQRFFIITDLNQFELLNPSRVLDWEGTGSVVIDRPVNDDLPRGEYQLYLLRMPEGVKEPLNNLDRGELQIGHFSIQ